MSPIRSYYMVAVLSLFFTGPGQGMEVASRPSILSASPIIGAGETSSAPKETMAGYSTVQGTVMWPDYVNAGNARLHYPAKEETTIAFGTPDPGDIRITVYNILGETVKKMVAQQEQRNLPAGLPKASGQDNFYTVIVESIHGLFDQQTFYDVEIQEGSATIDFEVNEKISGGQLFSGNDSTRVSGNPDYNGSFQFRRRILAMHNTPAEFDVYVDFNPMDDIRGFVEDHQHAVRRPGVIKVGWIFPQKSRHGVQPFSIVLKQTLVGKGNPTTNVS